MAVHIDHGMCSGTRNCERHYAELFVVDGGKSWLREDVDWTNIDVTRIQEAESACPWGAIEVDDSRPLEGEQT